MEFCFTEETKLAGKILFSYHDEWKKDQETFFSESPAGKDKLR